MTWQTTYPTLATAMAASFETLLTWSEQLPRPQTDVERTIMRRIIQRRDQFAGEQLRTHHPHIADTMNQLGDLMEKIGMPRTMGRM